jgi:hypothetical protein
MVVVLLFTTLNKHEIGLCDITGFSRIDLFPEESSCILNFFTESPYFQQNMLPIFN